MLIVRLVVIALMLSLPGNGSIQPNNAQDARQAGVLASFQPLANVTGGPPAAVVAKRTAPMPLGVQTHFSQHWPASLINRVRAAGAMTVRDGIAWSRGEPTPGAYALDRAAPAALDAMCGSGVTLLLTVAPQHPAYDDGKTVHTDGAIAAYARYAGALADRYRACLVGIEVGNEINDPRNLRYPAGIDGPGRYVALIRAVHGELRRRGSTAAVVCGSTNVIGTGFLDRLFAAGLLDAADAIAVNPYRSEAENVDREIAHLGDLMKRHGRVLPIWATEFSDNYATPEIAAEQLVKMVTLLSASGVGRGFWYALIDQRWFHNMGLYAANGDEKPAAQAFLRMAQLTQAARAERVDLGDSGIRLYRFGANTYVLWGGGGRVAFAGTPTIHDAYGRAIGNAEAGTIPLIVTEAGAPSIAEPSGIVADTMFGYGRAPWSYLAQTGDGVFHPLKLSDGQWDSVFASRLYQPLRIGSAAAAVAGTGASPVRAIIRYIARVAHRLVVSSCFVKRAKGDGVDIAIVAAGRTIWRGVLTREMSIDPIDVTLPRGGILDISIGPNQTAGGDAFAYRVRLSAPGDRRAVACPHRPVSAS